VEEKHNIDLAGGDISRFDKAKKKKKKKHKNNNGANGGNNGGANKQHAE